MANWLAQHLEQSDRAGWPVHARDRNSVHVRRPDGVIEAEIATRPLHYRNEHGLWQPIDTGLVRSTRGGREYRADGVPVSVQADGLVSITGSKHQQRTRRLVIFDVVKQQVVKTLALFGDGIAVDDCLLRGLDSIRHTLQVLPDGLREDVTIRDAISGVRASEWLMLETEIMGASWPDGWIKALPPVGDYHFPPPTLQDATGRVLRASMYAQRQNNAQLLYSGVPLAVLGGLVFPVVLDPNFSLSASQWWYGQSILTYEDAWGTYTGTGSPLVGQNYYSDKGTDTWQCCRAKLAFDASSTVGENILALVLRLATPYNTTLADTIEITQLNEYSDYSGAVSADRDTDWQLEGVMLSGETYYDSLALNVDYFTSTGGEVNYGLLGYKDRIQTSSTADERIRIAGPSYPYTNPPLLVVLYSIPVSGALLRHPGMAGGMNG